MCKRPLYLLENEARILSTEALSPEMLQMIQDWLTPMAVVFKVAVSQDAASSQDGLLSVLTEVIKVRQAYQVRLDREEAARLERAYGPAGEELGDFLGKTPKYTGGEPGTQNDDRGFISRNGKGKLCRCPFEHPFIYDIDGNSVGSDLRAVGLNDTMDAMSGDQLAKAHIAASQGHFERCCIDNGMVCSRGYAIGFLDADARPCDHDFDPTQACIDANCTGNRNAMACKDYCGCGMPLECMSSFSCAKRALSNRYQWMQAEGPVLLRHLRWPQPRLDFQPAQEGLLDDWTALENWHQEGLYSHDHFTTYTAFRHLVEDHVQARGRAEGVRVGKNLKNGWLERGVESVLDKNLMLEARQKNLMDMPLEDPQWTTFRHKVRDCYERIYASLVGDGAVLNADGAESNLGIREADNYLSNTLRKGMMDQELTALVCNSYSSDEAWEGWEGLRALDDHFDQQMDQPQELDESLAGAELSGPTGASEPTATLSETLEDREFAEYCAVCYIGTRRHVARRSCKGPTKGTVHTSCLDCYYKLPILESLHNDIFEVAIDANKMSKRVGRCKTCKGCGGYLRDRNFQSCYIVGDAVLCMECTKNAQATTWPLPTERKSILLCEWCQTSVCNKTLFDCCP